MKQLQLIIYTFLLFTFFTFSKCNKDDLPLQLPPETTIGANTFGCKINGQIFVPRDGGGKAGLDPEYVNLGTGVGGGWYLNIPAVDWKSSQRQSVNIGTDSLLLKEGVTYNFKNLKNFPNAIYYNAVSYPKLDNENGILYISKFDQIKHILSGTFSFVGTNVTTGEKIYVTEGRFDIRY